VIPTQHWLLPKLYYESLTNSLFQCKIPAMEKDFVCGGIDILNERLM
jgi:hypothetical protein